MERQPEHIEVVQVVEVDDGVVNSLARLLPQLSTSARQPSAEHLREILTSDATTLLLAQDADGSVVGTTTLAVFRVPTGVRAWIEDVVVDTACRGRGVAALLVQEALKIAKARGARTVDLTSRGSREAANRLYARLGFRVRHSNLFRYEFDGEEEAERGGRPA